MRMCYVAVPRMEPSLAVRKQRQVDHEDLHRSETMKRSTKYQLLLSNYFPKDHWSQTRPPKVIANSTEQAMLVFDDFNRRPGPTKAGRHAFDAG